MHDGGSRGLGSDINFGTLECEPKIEKEKFSSVAEVDYKNIREVLKQGRVNTIVQAGYRLQKKYPDIPVIGNLTGPISTAASIVDPMSFLKELRKDKDMRTESLITSPIFDCLCKINVDNRVT